jgi:uncharacterized protein YbjT (DUF2867 family)
VTHSALPIRVLVTGANGNLGRLLIRRWTRRGIPAVRALVRSERAAALVRALPEPPEVAVADYGDPAGLTRAAEGCQAIVHLVGILKETSTSTYAAAHEGSARALVDAASRKGIRRILYLSILGASPDARNACLASKGRAEAILSAPPFATSVLRVPMVLGGDDPATHALRARARSRWVPLVRGGASLEQPIDAWDVVAAITAALERPSLAGAALDLGGPESIPHRELVRRAAALLGNRPRIVPVPLLLARLLAAAASRFSADPPLTPAMLGVLEQDDRVDPAPACAKLGIELTPLDETLRRCLGAGAEEEEP